MSRTLHVGMHEVELTHEEKELFPKNHITKKDLIEYYQRIWPIIWTHLKDRPISMQRFPMGIDHQGFFQKNAPDYFPPWIKIKKVAKKEAGVVNYVMINNEETLVYLANQGCITPHIWLSHVENINNPDRMVFDLDPSGNAKFQLVRWVAQKLKKELALMHLTSFVMSTGSRGLHVVVPLHPEHSFDEVRAFAHNVAQELANEYPSYITIEARKKERGNKIYIDILRNGFGQTTVAPYAIRPLPGAPVAVPLEWSELSRITPQKYTLKNVFRRISQKGDVWHDINKHRQRLKRV